MTLRNVDDEPSHPLLLAAFAVLVALLVASMLLRIFDDEPSYPHGVNVQGVDP